MVWIRGFIKILLLILFGEIKMKFTKKQIEKDLKEFGWINLDELNWYKKIDQIRHFFIFLGLKYGEY